MSSYNRYNRNRDTDFTEQNNRGFFSSLLKKLSNYGMDTSDLKQGNSYGTGKFEDPDDNNNNTGEKDDYCLYDGFSKKVLASFLNKKSIAYLDRSIMDKIKILRQYSMKDEIREFITEIADESIIFDDDNYFCSLKDLPEEYSQTIREKYQENFKKIYRNFSFNESNIPWQYFKDFLIDGHIAFEIIYDSKQKNIERLYPLDPTTLLPAFNPETNVSIWIQYPEDPNNRSILLDSQIIYISFSNNSEYSETSYVENLIKPYNQLKLLEYTRILYNINQAQIYKKFVIPVGGLTKSQAEQSIAELRSDYHEEVTYDDTMGTIEMNGNPQIPHSKDFWFPTSPEGGTPDIDIINPQGANLNEDEVLNWFFRNLKRASHLPMSRFEDDTGGNIVYDNSEMTRDEIKFARYIDRLRTIFKEILIKPLKIQMVLDFPELYDDYLFESYIKLDFNSSDLFEEMKYLTNLSKRSEIASTLSGNLQDSEEKPYFHNKWIVKHIMNLSEEDIAENERYKLQDANGGSAGEGGGEGGDMGGEPGGDVQGGEESFDDETGEELGGEPQGELGDMGDEEL